MDNNILSKVGLDANLQYYEAIAKRASKEYRDAMTKVSDIISIEVTKKTDNYIRSYNEAIAKIDNEQKSRRK